MNGPALLSHGRVGGEHEVDVGLINSNFEQYLEMEASDGKE